MIERLNSPIVIIVNALYPGGAERLIIDSIHEMATRGIDVRLITVRPEKPSMTFAGELHISPGHLVVVPFRSVLDLPAMLRLVVALRRIKPRTVITHLWLANTVGRIAAFIARVPRVFTFEHNVYDSIKSPRHFFVDRVLARFTDRILAPSLAIKNSAIRHGIHPEKISVVHGGFNFGLYRATSKDAARKKYRINPAEFVFLFLGRLIYQKGVDVLLSAFAQIDGGKLFIVGGGEKQKELEAMAKNLGIQHRVYFTGFCKDISEFYALADCFVLPSRWEGLPISIAEAMVAGLPVIATKTDGNSEGVRDGINGLLVEPENPKTLALAMQRMREDTTLREKLVRQGLQDAEEFNITRHVDRLLKAISWVL